MKEKLKIFLSKTRALQRNPYLHAFFFIEKKQCVVSLKFVTHPKILRGIVYLCAVISEELKTRKKI